MAENTGTANKDITKTSENYLIFIPLFDLGCYTAAHILTLISHSETYSSLKLGLKVTQTGLAQAMLPSDWMMRM